MKETIKIETIYDFCDAPQIFSARDAYDTLYLCLMYNDEPMQYTAVRITSSRLRDFEQGKVDLRNLFVSPEVANEYFDVVCTNEGFVKTKIDTITEDKLPSEGYVLSESDRETIAVNIPLSDHSLFQSLVNKFGWVAM